MMKNRLKNKSIVIIVALLTIFTSCSDYLSELPDNRTIIDSKDKIAALLIKAYPENNYMLMAELMSDNAGDRDLLTRTQPLELSMYSWKDTNLEDADTPINYWNACYAAIAQANQALKSIKELGKSVDLSAQKGEALLARAYAHFMLVNFWGKRYNPTTSATDLGVPYVLEPETVLLKKYKRNTVKEVYDLIEKDLTEGLKLVKNKYDQPKFHFTKEAANAFAARFYTYKGDWDKVITHASKAIANVNQIRNLKDYTGLSYDQIAELYASSRESDNLLIVSTYSYWKRKFAGSRFGLTVDKLHELFFGGVGNPFKKGWLYRVFGNDTHYNLPKFREHFKYSNQSAGIGNPYVGIVLFDRDEALLNRAEAYAMKKDYANALKDLNAFLSFKTDGYKPETDVLTKAMVVNKYPVVKDELTPFYPIDATQTSFVKAVLEFKRREFYHEGLRWFDIKRFNIKVTHKLGSSKITLLKDDKRRELQIPSPAVKQGIQQNPR